MFSTLQDIAFEIHCVYKKKGQLGLRISKLILLLIFGQIEAEKIEVKDTRGHFHFSHDYVRNYPVSAAVIALLEFQNLNLTSCITVLIFSTQMSQFLKILKKLILENSFLNNLEKWFEMNWKNENWKWPMLGACKIWSHSIHRGPI